MHESLIERIADFLSDYLVFEDQGMPLALALWVSMTHIFESFDAFPYLVITSYTKRSGKTRAAEMLSLISHNSQNSAGITPAALFRIITPIDGTVPPTIYFDEAELLSSESASTMRALLNVGYRKGQTIPRVSGESVINYKTYCPKAFILIGDVYDTLKDRSIIVNMKRAEPRKRFSFDLASAAAAILKDQLLEILRSEGIKERIKAQYDCERASFLTDRDEEIWRPLFSAARILTPNILGRLQVLAVDLCSAKMSEKRRYSTLDMFDTQAENDEYAEKLLRDCHLICGKPNGKIHSETLIGLLKWMPLAPWRKFRGDGLSNHNLADLLSRFGLNSKPMRVNGKLKRGYDCSKIHKAFHKLDAKKGEGDPKA